ncbi:hypothetical protein ACLMJK_003276 [Lecanora helva]
MFGVTVTFIIFGDTIDEQSMLGCEAEAMKQAIYKGPMGVTARTWRSPPRMSTGANASLGLTPTSKLTWAMWRTTLAMMGFPTIIYQRSFSFSIKGDKTGDLEIGSGLMKLSQNEDRVADWLVGSANESLGIMPEPFDFRLGSTIARFYAYEEDIDKRAGESVYLDAWEDILGKDPHDLIGANVKDYSDHLFGARISLVLIPSDKLTWGMWVTVLTGLARFDPEGWRELSFNITDDTEDTPVGWGLLKVTPDVNAASN